MAKPKMRGVFETYADDKLLGWRREIRRGISIADQREDIARALERGDYYLEPDAVREHPREVIARWSGRQVMWHWVQVQASEVILAELGRAHWGAVMERQRQMEYQRIELGTGDGAGAQDATGNLFGSHDKGSNGEGNG